MVCLESGEQLIVNRTSLGANQFRLLIPIFLTFLLSFSASPHIRLLVAFSLYPTDRGALDFSAYLPKIYEIRDSSAQLPFYRGFSCLTDSRVRCAVVLELNFEVHGA